MKRTTWEYRLVSFHSTYSGTRDLEGNLRAMGADGWEAVCLVIEGVMLFKRLKVLP